MVSTIPIIDKKVPMKKKNKERIYRMFFITSIYNAYTLMHLKTQVLQSNNKNVGNTSNLVNHIFGLRTNPNDFYSDPDELSDECIGHHQFIETMMGLADGMYGLSKDLINNFLEQIEHTIEGYLLKTHHYLYSEIFATVTAYLKNQISKEELREYLKYYQNLKFPFTPLQGRKLVLMMQKSEQLLNHIIKSRK